jgi:hypothetical protein
MTNTAMLVISALLVFAYLLDIFGRVTMPDLDSVPDVDEVSEATRMAYDTLTGNGVETVRILLQGPDETPSDIVAA